MSRLLSILVAVTFLRNVTVKSSTVIEVLIYEENPFCYLFTRKTRETIHFFCWDCP